MASKKSFKPPVKNKSDNSEMVRKPTMSLTDAQYEEIFKAVIHPSQQGLDIKSPTVADFPGNKAASPKESASVENSQNSQPIPTKSSKENENSEKLVAKTLKNTDTSTLSTINSEDFVNNTVFSTPNKTVKPKSYREALNNLKKIHTKLSDSFSETDPALNSSIAEMVLDGPLSQPPSQLEKMDRLLWYQKRRATGLWVQCDNPQCDKWRWLDTADPCELPDKWYCYMNPDPTYATCDVPEKPIPLHMEADMIHNCYTAGSIVWGKVAGYPWWPAMVDDCPDEEQYYWVDDPACSDVPDWYHVVFFDDTDVTRKWLRLPQIKSFKQHPDLDKKFNIKQIFQRRLAISKQKANEALKMSVKERLEKFSFISLWKKELPNFDEFDSDSDAEVQKSYEKQIKKIISQRTNTIANKAQKKNKLGKNDKKKKMVSPKNKVTKPEKLRRSPRKSIEKRRNTSEKTEDETNKDVQRKNSTNKNNENLKSSLQAEPIKPKLSRRMSTGTILKENKVHSSFKSADTTLEEESLMEKVYNNCREQFMNGKIELSKFEEIYKQVQEERKKELSESAKTPPKRRTSVRSSPRKTSSNEPIAKEGKKEKTPPTKITNVVKKMKKSFVMPVKKSVDLNSSVTSIASSITSEL